jgi:hypothetical protein
MSRRPAKRQRTHPAHIQCPCCGHQLAPLKAVWHDRSKITKSQ